MSDRIEPALTPEEWRDGEFDSHYGASETSLHIDHKGRVIVHSDLGKITEHVTILNESYTDGVLTKIIALANAALPDDDPRKITRELIQRLRDSAVSVSDDYSGPWWLNDLADALESYLPPEG